MQSFKNSSEYNNDLSELGLDTYNTSDQKEDDKPTKPPLQRVLSRNDAK